MGTHQHILTNVDPHAGFADCAACGPAAPVVYKAHKGRWACRVAERRRSPAARRRRSRAAQLAKYGLTLATYEALVVDQFGLCAICKQETDLLVVDYCHETGQVRGLLCTPCNQGLGFFRDSPERLRSAITYLAN